MKKIKVKMMPCRYGSLWVVLAVLIASVALFSGWGFAGQKDSAGKGKKKADPVVEDPKHIQSGDYVVVHYGLSLENGRLIVTSSKKRSEDADQKKVSWFFAPTEYGPENIIAGKESATPELARAVVGMAKGDKKSLKLSPEQGFGKPDEKQIVSYPTVKKMSRKTKMSAQQYTSRFRSFPVVGKSVPLTPYFSAKIIKVDDAAVTLEALPKDGDVIPSEFGDTKISVNGDEISMTLSPKVGAPFVLTGRSGIIKEVEGTTFKVDYNHPAAGKPLVLDIEIVSFAKASAFASKEMAWVEDHDKGYKAAAAKKKPMVMVLYAGWCGWSKRLLDETIKDPRIQEYWDDFVWVKVDSDKNKEYHEFYEQKGYPMIVLVNPQGKVIKKLDGFKDARALMPELDQCLDNATKG